MNLSLTAPMKIERSDGDESYKQYLRKDGKKLVISTPMYRLDGGLRVNNSENSITYVHVPLDLATIQSLYEIEQFVKANVDSPRFKPLWHPLKDNISVNLSKWCRYELINTDGSSQIFPVDLVMGFGWYKFDIQASHVYVGPHKNGETFSISLHVIRIAYKPADNLDTVMTDLIQCLDSDHSEPPTCPPPATPTCPPTTPMKKAKQTTEKKKRRQRKAIPKPCIQDENSRMSPMNS